MDANTLKSFTEVIQSRRSTRSFAHETPSIEAMHEIIQAAVYAPYGGATGMPLNEIRKIFVFSQGTEQMKKARDLILIQIQKNAKKLNFLLTLLPFLRNKMGSFSNRLNGFAKTGIPALHDAAYYIVIAEKKGFPPVEKQSIAHTLQNMWLSATNQGLGFQLVSATGIMANNKQFIALLGLSKGVYALDGCVVGVPRKTPESRKKFKTDDFVTWIR